MKIERLFQISSMYIEEIETITLLYYLENYSYVVKQVLNQFQFSLYYSYDRNLSTCARYFHLAFILQTDLYAI